MNLKKAWIKYGYLLKPMLEIYNRFFNLKITSKGTNNTITGIEQCRMKNVKIRIQGNNNRIIIGEMSSLFNISISIVGSGNTVTIGNRNYLQGCNFCVEDNDNVIALGTHVYIYDNSELSAIETTEIQICEDCLISSDVMIRTGDSHGIYDIRSGNRINESKNIYVNSHIWIGNGCKILKGSYLNKGCIIGTGSIVTSRTKMEDDCMLAGIPAGVIKREVMWTHER